MTRRQTQTARTHPYLAALRGSFDGLLRHGTHRPNGEACAHEVAAVARGIGWTDDPEKTGLPDTRQLNDGPWSSDAARTEHLVPVIVALWDWVEWSEERRVRWAQTVALRTIREVLPPALRAAGLDPDADRCAQAETLSRAHYAAEAARDAANAARFAAALSAADAADSAVEAARYAADATGFAANTASSAANTARSAANATRSAANAAGNDAPLILACRIWREAAEEVLDV